MMRSRSFAALAWVLATTATEPASAETGSAERASMEDGSAELERGGGALEALGAPHATLRVGVLLPMFLIYELPGPLAGVALEWPISERLGVVARGELGALFFDGSQRYVGKLGVGIRVAPWPRSPVAPWALLGLGAAGYAERISVVLPERVASATDLGGSLTADLAVGVHFLQRWELGVGWDHIIWPLPYYETYQGTESLPNRGTALVWLGVQL